MPSQHQQAQTAPILRAVFTFDDGRVIVKDWTEATLTRRRAMSPAPGFLRYASRDWPSPNHPVTIMGNVKRGREEDALEWLIEC